MTSRTDSDALVRPRVIVSGEASDVPTLLEEVVGRLLARGAHGLVALKGRAGFGKTTALAVLARAFAHEARLGLRDDVEESAAPVVGPGRLQVVAARRIPPAPYVAQLELAPWGRDECIEYLLAAHRESCALVMGRWHAAHDALGGHPELCRELLDRLACDPSLADADAALAQHAAELLGTGRRRAAVIEVCVELVLVSDPGLVESLRARLEALVGARACRSLQPELVHEIAAGQLAERIASGSLESVWLRHMPADLERRLVRRLAGKPRAWIRLWSRLAKPGGEGRTALANLCYTLDPLAFGRRLARASGRRTICAILDARLVGAPWSGLCFRTPVLLDRCDLSGAELREARFEALSARSARLAGMDLSGAQLGRLTAEHANLTGATLDDARLERARFNDADLTDVSARRAYLRGSNFSRATLDRADLRDANLERANLSHVDLRSCDLLGAVLRDANLLDARLDGVRLDRAVAERVGFRAAHLTGASLRGARLADASLSGARLAGVDASDADLRGADLSRVVFHMGSTRSGLLFGAPPMEGSRTGFYDRESVELAYKRPEELRVANFCGADLRGANLAGTDFYLVDLRGARLDPPHVSYVRRCGAILD